MRVRSSSNVASPSKFVRFLSSPISGSLILNQRSRVEHVLMSVIGVRRSLGARLQDDANSGMTLKSGSATGAMEMSFQLDKVRVAWRIIKLATTNSHDYSPPAAFKERSV